MPDRKTDYLIIGNSAAGVTAAETVRQADQAASILIVGDEPHHVYGRPLISYMIEGKTDEGKIGFKDQDFYARNRIQTMLGPEYRAVELLPSEHSARLADGTSIGYGKCLLATGSRPFVPPIKGLDERDSVYGFMTLDDAKSAWKAAEEATHAAHEKGRTSRIVVIGAGLIGLKAAEALSHHADEVLVLELAPRILPAVLDGKGASILQQILADHGIECRPGVSAQEVKDSSVILTDGTEIDCDIVIAAVGVRPNSQLAVDAGAEEGRGLIVDNRMQTTLPDIYAAGDVVQVTDALDGSQHPLALWPNAIRQGRIAALAMAESEDFTPAADPFAVNAVDFFDASLLTAGLINPVEGSGCDVIEFTEGESYAKFVTRDGHLVGYILLNRPENAGLYTAMIEERIPLADLDDGIFEARPENLSFPEEHRWRRLHPNYPRHLDRLGWRREAS